MIALTKRSPDVQLIQSIQAQEIETLRDQADKIMSTLENRSIQCDRISLDKEWTSIMNRIESIDLELSDKVYMSGKSGKDFDAYEVIEMITPNKWMIRSLRATLDPQAKKQIDLDVEDGRGTFASVANCCQRWIYESAPSAPLIEVNRVQENIFTSHGSSIIFYPGKSPYKFHDYNF